jgi:hypothetical protein
MALFGRFLFWGSPFLAAAILISIVLFTGRPPVGSHRIEFLLYVNGILSFMGSAIGAFLVPKTVSGRVMTAPCGGVFGAGAYVMLTLLADEVVPGF